MNTIRSLEPIPNDAVKIKEKNRKAKTLYIEADEDHVAKQKGKQVEPKLVYVHEGYEENKGISDRKKLKNVRYFSGVYSNSDKLWEEVLDYLDAAYDLDAVNKIYLSGDAALWIRNGVNWIPDSKYVLDRYHLAKYVRKMTAHLDKSYEKYFWELLEDDKKEALYLLLEKIKNETERETKLKTVNESIRYIKKHYKAIRRYYNDDYIGCSAEAHVSHLLSDRLSSRPLGWSRIGVDLMARLRTFIANGGNIYAYVMSQLKKTIKENKHVKMIKRMNKNVKSKMKETIFNVEIPVISFGKTSGTYHAVNGLR
jgi:6-pyruvoyl-tetrahydropterin synthase